METYEAIWLFINALWVILFLSSIWSPSTYCFVDKYLFNYTHICKVDTRNEKKKLARQEDNEEQLQMFGYNSYHMLNIQIIWI